MPIYNVEHDGKKFRVEADNPEMAAEALEQHTGTSPEPSIIKQAIGKLAQPITSYPETYERMKNEGLEQTGRGIEQLESGEPGQMARGAVNTAVGGLSYLGSPISAGIDTLIGKPVEGVTGIPSEYADFAASLAMPIPKRIPRIGGAATLPEEGPLGVTLSEGQRTGDLSAIQREQAALRGQSGPPAQRVAEDFRTQQESQLTGARQGIKEGLDPFGQQVAKTPQEAGDVVSQSMQRMAAQRKADVGTAYETARSYPGEIHAGAFEGMPQKIKSDLSARDEPIIIDDKLTPFASQAIKDIDKRVGKLKIQNRADPFGQPNAKSIVGVDLKGVDQMRRRLSTFRSDAFASGNAADGRAAKAVLDAFDDHIDQAVNSGLFNGDPRAVKAWNDARASHADYKRAFSAGKNDPIGRVIERIIGKGNNPAAIGNDVADFMYGASGVNPSSLNAGVVSRLKTMFGEQSPEWSAIKQGLFARLTESGEGVTDFGAGKVAQRLNKFLNVDGKEMAARMFSEPERDMLKKYADVMRKIEVPQAGANWSNTATFAAKALDHIGSQVGMVVGSLVGHAVGGAVGLPMGVGEAAGLAAAAGPKAMSHAAQARKIAKQMPIISKVMEDYQNAAQAFETTPRTRAIARMSLASRNLSTNLKDIGITMSPQDLMRAIQGPVAAPAQEENTRTDRIINR
jgi:hypothetical protein